MQSFVKIGGQVFELWSNRKHRDIHLLLLGWLLFSGFSILPFCYSACKHSILTRKGHCTLGLQGKWNQFAQFLVCLVFLQILLCHLEKSIKLVPLKLVPWSLRWRCLESRSCRKHKKCHFSNPECLREWKSGH